MSDYFNLNDGVKEVKSKFPKFGSFSFKLNRKLLALVLVAAIGIPLTVVLSQQEQDTRQFASEDNPKNLIINKNTKPEYVKGEIIVKMASDLDASIKPDARARGVSLEKKQVAFSDLDSATIPLSLKRLNSKYLVENVERIFSKSKVRSNLRSRTGGIGINNTNSAEVKNDIALIYKIKFKGKNLDPNQVISDLRGQVDVLYAEPNYIYKATEVAPQGGEPTSSITPSITPSDTPAPSDNPTPSPTPDSGPHFNDPYYLDHYPDNVSNRDSNWNPNYDYQWNLKTVSAEGAWKTLKDSLPSIKVAVIDTGVDYAHTEFGGCNLDQVNANQCPAVAPGYNFVGDVTQENNNPMDDFGHGTHVAGIIAAISNDQGIAGMASGVKIMPIKGLDANGSGTLEDLAQGIYYAADNGAKIINASWGGIGNSITLEQAIAYAYSKGVVFVAAAGNSNVDVANFTPANITCVNSAVLDIDCVLTVSSVNSYDFKSYFSNYGTGIDVAAPGEEVISLKSDILYDRFNNYVVGNNYLRLSGTSMAAPHVAGSTALILAKNPALTPKQVRNIIINGADKIGDPDYDGSYGFDNKYGYGRINAKKSVEEMNTEDKPVAKISYPISGMPIGNKFNIYGSAKSSSFLNYKIYTYNDRSSSWVEDGVTLVNSGNQGVDNGLLGSISLNPYVDTTNSSVGPAGGEGGGSGGFPSKLRLVVVTRDGKKYFTDAWIRIDKSIKQGFPVEYGANPAFSPPLIADINNDGKKEIISQSTRDGKISVLDSNGKNIAGWPKDSIFPSRGVSDWVYPDWVPVAVDIDSSYPGKEIIFPMMDPDQYKTDLIAYHADGTLVAGWAKENWDNKPPVGRPGWEDGTISSGIIGGKNYILLAEGFPPGVWVAWGTPYRLHLFDSSGNEPTGWPVDLDVLPRDSDHYYSVPVIADLDNDNDPEILLIRDGDEVWIYNKFGQIKKKIKITSELSEYINNWFIADLNSDGKKEIVISTIKYTYDSNYTNIVGQNKIHIIGSNGQEISNKWPYSVTENLDFFSSNSLTIGDYNNDSKPVLLNYFNQKYHLLNANGDNLSGSPYLDSYPQKDPRLSSNVSLVDGSELLSISDPQYFYDPLRLLKYKDGIFSDIEGFPKSFYTSYTGAYISGYPALEDLEGDKLVDLTVPVWILGSGLDTDYYLYSYNVNQQVKSYDWSQFLHDERHSNTYDSNSITPTPSPIPTPISQTLKLTPSADSYVRSDKPTTNFGLLSYLQTDSNPNTISFLKFNLTPLSGKRIVSAKLRIKISSASNTSQILKRADDKSWGEKGINYNNKPGLVANISTFKAPAGGKIVEIDVTSAVKLKKGANLTFGITSSVNSVTKYYSRESANKPELIVIYQ